MNLPDSISARERDFDVGSNLQEIADRLSELVGNPITIEGTDFRLIAHSPQVDNVDEVRKATILGRRVPEAVVRALWSSGVVDHLHSSRTAIRVQQLKSVGLAGRVAIAVRVGQDVVAHIWVQEVNRPLQDSDMVLLQHAANMVALELLHIGYVRETKDRMVSSFLDELLVSGNVDEGEAQVRAARLGLSLPSPYQVVVVGGADDPAAADDNDGHYLDGREVMRTAGDVVSRHGVWSAATRRDGCITFVISADVDAAPDERHVAHAICDALVGRGHEVLVGVSQPEQGYQNVSRAYQEALRCFRVAKLLGWRNNVVTGASLGVLQWLPQLSQSYEENVRSGAVHARLQRLLEEDQNQNGFSMIETIEAFLDCGGNTKRAAELLHIHVNTLNYRLRKIFERTGFNPFNGLERLAVHMELKLRRLAGRTWNGFD